MGGTLRETGPIVLLPWASRWVGGRRDRVLGPTRTQEPMGRPGLPQRGLQRDAKRAQRPELSLLPAQWASNLSPSCCSSFGLSCPLWAPPPSPAHLPPFSPFLWAFWRKYQLSSRRGKIGHWLVFRGRGRGPKSPDDVPPRPFLRLSRSFQEAQLPSSAAQPLTALQGPRTGPSAPLPH